MTSPALRQKVLTLTSGIDELRQLGLVLSVDGKSELLSQPQGLAHAHQYVIIDIETGKPEINMREVSGEGILLAINCSAAIVAGVVTFGTVAAAPVSGGASLALTSVGYAATAATGLSCFNSIARTYNAVSGNGLNTVWDDVPAYRTTLKVLDGVSLLGVGASAVAAAKAVKILGNAGISIKAAVKGNVSRQQSAHLSKEIAKHNQPGISNGKLKDLIKTGDLPKRYPAKEVSSGSIKQLKGSAAASLSFLSSAFDGHVKSIAIYVIKLVP